jgi:hypothetical protein
VVVAAVTLAVCSLAGVAVADGTAGGAVPAERAGSGVATADLAPPDNATLRNESGTLPVTGAKDVYDLEPDDDVGKIVVLATTPMDSDFDLYATADGRTPTRTDYDFESYSRGPVEKLEIPAMAVERSTNLTLAIRSYNGSAAYKMRIVKREGSTNATNRKPVAALSYKCVAAQCVYKASGRDTDGTVEEYALDLEPGSSGPTHTYERPNRTIPKAYTSGFGGSGGHVERVATVTLTDDDSAERTAAVNASVYAPFPPLESEVADVPDEADDKLTDGSDTLGSVEGMDKARDGDPATGMTIREEYIGTPKCTGFLGCIIDGIKKLFGGGNYFYGLAASIVHGVPADDIQTDDDVQDVKFQISYEMVQDPEPVDVTVYTANKSGGRTKLAEKTLDPADSKTSTTFDLPPSKLERGVVVVYESEVEDEGEDAETWIRVYDHNVLVVTSDSGSAP